MITRFLFAGFALFLSAPAFAQSEAVVEQVGAGHVVALTQLTAEQALATTATIRQEAGGGGGGHLALLTQSGGATADVFQTGTGHRLTGLDGGSPALSLDGSTLVLAQSGTANAAFVEQAAGAVAHITQIGTGNTATVIQH